MRIDGRIFLSEAFTQNAELFLEIRDNTNKPLYRIRLRDCKPQVKMGVATFDVPTLTPDEAMHVCSVWLMARINKALGTGKRIVPIQQITLDTSYPSTTSMHIPSGGSLNIVGFNISIS